MRAFLASYLRLNRTRVWVLLLAGLSAALAFTPLFDLLGYEFCLALALAVSLAAAHLGSVMVAQARARDEGMVLALARPLPALVTLLLRCATANLLLLVAPLLVISLNALRVRNCDYLEGLAFFGMMPVLSAIVASCVGVLVALAVPRRGLASAGAVLAVVLSLLWGLWRFYGAPPIFGYDPFAGYFPGALYDEDVAIRAPFLLFRLYNLVWLVAATLLAAPLFESSGLCLRLGRFRRPTLPAAAALAAGVGLFLLRGPLGFAIDADQIAAELGGMRQTAHFVIHHPAGMEPERVDLLAQDHEFRYAQLAALFGDAPARITSFVFESPEQKRALMGASHTFVAKPWRREVYLQQGGFPQPALKHELAHVFAGLHGDRLFGVSLRWRTTPLPHPVFNVGLIEGIAVAADWKPYGELTGHQMAAALIRLGLAPPPETLFGYGFLTRAASRSYILAGSFCRFLLAQQGMPKLAAVYRNGGDFAAAYGEPLEALLKRWSRFIEQVKVPPEQLQLARERFRRPSILRRVCSHEVANLVAEANARRDRREFTRAARVLEQVCSYDPAEPTHLLRWMQAEAEAGKPEAALAIGQRLLDHPALSAPLRREALERVGDLHWLADRDAKAARAYRRAAQQAAGPFDRRVLHLKRWALDQPERVRRLVRGYLVPPPGTPRDPGLDVHLAHRLQQELAPTSGLGLFLVGKQLVAGSHCDEAAPVLRQALSFGLPTADFVIEAHLVLGRCQYQLGDNSGAEATFSAIRDRGGQALKLEVEDWLERIRWRTGQIDGAAGPVAH